MPRRSAFPALSFLHRTVVASVTAVLLLGLPHRTGAQAPVNTIPAIQQRLARQEADARDWRDACLLYFQQFSQRPLPTGVEAAPHPLEFYTSKVLKNMPGHK